MFPDALVTIWRQQWQELTGSFALSRREGRETGVRRHAEKQSGDLAWF